MTVSILVPYRTDHGHRERSWGWVSDRWKELFPDFEIVLGDNTGGFSRSAAINDAARKATGDVFIIADCDTTFYPASWINSAISKLDTWGLARTYEKLTADYTKILLKGSVSLEERKTEYVTDFSWSGIIVVKNDDFQAVGGFDERFNKWGEEDICFGLTMNELVGPVVRWPGYVCHLWHPQSNAETFGNSEFTRQHMLADRYRDAVGNKQKMSKVRFGGTE